MNTYRVATNYLVDSIEPVERHRSFKNDEDEGYRIRRQLSRPVEDISAAVMVLDDSKVVTGQNSRSLKNA